MVYMTDVAVSTNEDEQQQLAARGFKIIKHNLNFNKSGGGNRIYLCYKEGDTNPITRLQFSVTPAMESSLSTAGYTKIPKNLNCYAAGAESLYLWYYKGTTKYDNPIELLIVPTVPLPEQFQYGYERMSCDLNRGVGGAWYHISLKREKTTYICDVTASTSHEMDQDLFDDGYIRLDQDINAYTISDDVLFLWYRKTTDPKLALTHLEVSITPDQKEAYEKEGYTKLDVDFNQDTSGAPTFVWYKKAASSTPIGAITLLADTNAIDDYIDCGLTVIMKNLNAGTRGAVMYLAYNCE